MPRREKLSELRLHLTGPADTMPVRAMALICFAAASLLILRVVLDPENLPVSAEQRLIGVAVITSAGILCWVFARHFRVWMLHLIIAMGLISGFYGLSQITTSIGSAMTILTIFWTCLLIGSIFRPPLARIYGGFTFIGIAIGLRGTSATTGENLVMALGFGLTLIVTLELLSRTSSQLRDDATRDPLTGLLNRKGLAEAASQVARLSLRTGEPVAVVQFDLNDFKSVNDREGHQAGDRLLTHCAESWMSNIRPQDVLARYGGDEFVLLLPGTGPEEADAAMRRLGDSSPASFSYGIAIANPGDPFEVKLSEADARLIQAKAKLHDPTPTSDERSEIA